MDIHFTQDSSRAGIAIVARMFEEGWETLEPLRLFGCCGYYCTTLYLPETVQQG